MIGDSDSEENDTTATIKSNYHNLARKEPDSGRSVTVTLIHSESTKQRSERSYRKGDLYLRPSNYKGVRWQQCQLDQIALIRGSLCHLSSVN